MSFPSALSALLAMGVTPETATPEQAKQALLTAMQTDTKDGMAYLAGLVDACRTKAEDVVAHVRGFIACDGCKSKVLRAEWLPSGGLKVDVDPDSKLGKQVMRLLGTDAARAVASEHFGMSFALANCCGGIAGDDKKKTVFTPGDQIRWQTSIDC
jgi:hypothetical protein